MAKLKQSENMGEKFEASADRDEELILVTNRFNAPHDVQIGLFFKRLEPRGKEGDSVMIKKSLLSHIDFNSQKDYLIVEEKI
jgi:hypothetical protein